jgi:cyclopropane fatty-acyl-phospholipid synthase-like methyltransferase
MCNEFRDISFAYQSGESNVSKIIAHERRIKMSLRFHEIAETYHRILNPFTEDQLMLLGEICHLHSGMKLLDLACGKAEMLCRWVQQYGVITSGKAGGLIEP